MVSGHAMPSPDGTYIHTIDCHCCRVRHAGSRSKCGCGARGQVCCQRLCWLHLDRQADVAAALQRPGIHMCCTMSELQRRVEHLEEVVKVCGGLGISEQTGAVHRLILHFACRT